MNVQFITTTSEKLSALPLVNGQIIALSDRSGYYYDMGDTRYTASTVEFVDTLPATGVANTLYIYNSEMYIWATSKYKLLTSVPQDGRCYVRKNENWTTLDNTYTCIGTSADASSISSILNKYISNSNVMSGCLKIDGTLSVGDSNLAILISGNDKSRNKSISLDFSNCTISGSIAAGVFISCLNIGTLQITGLVGAPKTVVIQASNVKNIIIDSCSFFSNQNYPSSSITAIQASNGSLIVQNSSIDLNTIKRGIQCNNLSSGHIHDCTILGTDTAGRGIVITGSTNNINIDNNYISSDCVTFNGATVDPQFSNICPAE